MLSYTHNNLSLLTVTWTIWEPSQKAQPSFPVSVEVIIDRVKRSTKI